MTFPAFAFAARSTRVSLVLTALVALSACVPNTSPFAPEPPPPSAEELARTAALETAATAYGARVDGQYTIPAVPVEKIPEQFRRQEVDYVSDLALGSIEIHPGQKFLYLITSPGKAIRYGISVGAQGFDWAGEADVSRTRSWPTWTPPPEMIERNPKLEKWAKGQPGGPTNPLGARAIYLLTDGRDYGYRIHGTPDWWSIGKRASSGCFRMIHQDVIDLASRVQPGAKVVVLNNDGTRPTKLRLPPPQPKKEKPKAAVETTTPDATVAPATATTPAAAPATTPATAAPVVAAPATTAASSPAVAPSVSTAPVVTPVAPSVAPILPTPSAPVAPTVPVVTDNSGFAAPEVSQFPASDTPPRP